MSAATVGLCGKTYLVIDHSNKLGGGGYLSPNPYFCKSALSRLHDGALFHWFLSITTKVFSMVIMNSSVATSLILLSSVDGEMAVA